MEPALPSPRIGTKGVADAPRDRPNVNVAVVDVPAIWPFGVASAGELGHDLLKRRPAGQETLPG